MKNTNIWKKQNLNNNEKEVLSSAIDKFYKENYEDAETIKVADENIIIVNGKRYDKRYYKKGEIK